MRGWDNAAYSNDVEYWGSVYDENYNDAVSLSLRKDGKLVLFAEEITLDARGIENLRKKLQQVERHNKEQTS